MTGPRCFQVHPDDNVATLLDDAGPPAALQVLNGRSIAAIAAREPNELGHKIALALFAPLKPPTDLPNPFAMLAVRAGSDQVVVHRPMMIRAERQTVGGLVVAREAEGNDVCSLDQKEIAAEPEPYPASSTGVVVNLQDRPPERPITSWRHFLPKRIWFRRVGT